MPDSTHSPERPADSSTAEQLWSAVYRELRALAVRHLGSERQGHTLQPTALIHEVWIRLRGGCASVSGRAGFLAAAATAMRRILVDHARARTRRKRAHDFGRRVEFDDEVEPGTVSPETLLELDELLRELATLSERRAEVVQLRFFGGLTEVEAAEVLGVSRRTVQEEFRSARAWLRARLDAARRR